MSSALALPESSSAFTPYNIGQLRAPDIPHPLDSKPIIAIKPLAQIPDEGLWI